MRKIIVVTMNCLLFANRIVPHFYSGRLSFWINRRATPVVCFQFCAEKKKNLIASYPRSYVSDFWLTRLLDHFVRLLDFRSPQWQFTARAVNEISNNRARWRKANIGRLNFHARCYRYRGSSIDGSYFGHRAVAPRLMVCTRCPVSPVSERWSKINEKVSPS